MSDVENRDPLEERLRETITECERLRRENTHLRKLLSGFSLKPASDLETDKDSKVEMPSEDRSEASPKFSLDERLKIYRDLFRGREDVYAVRWENKKGKSGYSPACAYEWNPLYCKKPYGKCDICKYLPLTEEVIRDHLLGKITVGVYPLLKDETCHFLAVDFDKKDWDSDAGVFMETCSDLGFPAALERSRSGKGGHVWIFFAEAIPAALARNVGATLLTRAMETRHRIGLDSYDRLFPSQDRMPKGGFGNLIALPLQRHPRNEGNSVFIDENFVPYSDQWAFLASIERAKRPHVDSIVRGAAKAGTIIGVRTVETDDSSDDDPWTLPPSRRKPDELLKEPLPKSVRAVRANFLYIEKDGLSSQILNRLIRLASFQNPEFYRAQAMRLSTFGKPRVISCAEEFPNHLGLPRGSLDDLEGFLSSNGIPLEIKDERFAGSEIEVIFNGGLKPDQEKTVENLLAHDEGLLVAPTGFGKTVIAAKVIAERKRNALVLVHRKPLLAQWREQLGLFLNLPGKDIGTFGGGRKKPTGRIDIGIIQSLYRKGEVNDLVANYGLVIVDECHHLSAWSFEQVLKQVKAKYVYGLTATPIRKDGHHPIILMQCGPIRVRVDPKRQAQLREFDHSVIFKYTDLLMPLDLMEPTIHEVFQKIVQDEARNRMIIEDVNGVVKAGRSPLVLTERVEHLEFLAKAIKKEIDNVMVLRGGMGKKEQAAIDEILNKIPDEEPRVILATGRYIGEGFDDPRLDTLFMAFPISWRPTFPRLMAGNARWEWRPWRTKSSSRRW